jgi:predicted HTH domain antitoxin
MGFTYNVTEDYLYKEGLAKGQKAKEKELIVELLKEGTLSVEKIAAVAKVPVERVKKLAKELKK